MLLKLAKSRDLNSRVKTGKTVFPGQDGLSLLKVNISMRVEDRI